MHSVASRGGVEIADSLPRMLEFLKSCHFDLIIAETSGIGQANGAIVPLSDLCLYVMTSEFGAQSQLEKIDMIDFANFIAINKADHRGSVDALRDVRKQYKRSHKVFQISDEKLPVFLTQASQFNDLGVNRLFFSIVDDLDRLDSHHPWSMTQEQKKNIRGVEKQGLIPANRQNCLIQIASTIREYKKQTLDLAQKASKLGSFYQLKEELGDKPELEEKLKKDLPPEDLQKLQSWDEMVQTYRADEYVYKVRDQQVRQPLYHVSLSGTRISRLVPPDLTDWGDRLKFLKLENMPGYFPYTSGVFPLKRKEEDPTRMFAGEGGA